MCVLKKTVFVSVFLIMGLLTGLLSGCGLLPEEEEALAPPLIQPKREEYELYKAEKRDIIKYVKGVGTLEPVKEARLYFRELEKRLKAIEVKYGQQVEKGTVLARVDSGNLESNIRMQELEIDKILLQIDSLKKKLGKYESVSSEYQPPKSELEELQDSINLLEVDLKRAQITLGDLRKEYEESILVAPFSGQVTFIESLEEGDPVEAYKTVVAVADPKELQVYYQSDEMRRVKTGTKGQVKIGDTELEGEVVLCPDNTPVDAGEKYKNAILIQVDNLPEGAELGDTADFSIPVESRSNTVVIPKKGLHRLFGSAVVRVLDGDSKQELDVEVGIETPTEVEILKGLDEGQMVILN